MLTHLRSDDVTVVIPAKDRGHRLPKALDSIAKQSAAPREVIVVDDGSEDDTANIARQHGARVLVHGSSRGAAEARNTGINATRTPLVAFLDSDDVWLPNHLEVSLKGLGTNVFVTSPMIDTFGRVRGNVSSRPLSITPERLFFPENAVCTSTVLADRGAIQAAGGFRTFDRAEDLDLWIRLLDEGSAVALPSVTGLYFVEAAYVDERLASRNRSGTLAVLGRYASKPWATPRLRQLVALQQDWDEVRHALKNKGAPTVLQMLRLLRRLPVLPVGLTETFHHRLKARRLAARLGLSIDTFD